MMRRHDYLFYIGMLALLLAACSTTRNLPVDEVLYIGIKDTEVVNKDKSVEVKNPSTGEPFTSDINNI